MQLSIVSTLYHSAPYIEEFHRRVSEAAESLASEFEIILVNDGSPDDSLKIARGLTEHDPRVKVVDLSRNFGHHRALMTGLKYASGDLVFLIDSDLEEPPEVLVEFHQRIQQPEADVVYGVQESRKGGLVERASGAVFYSLFNLLSTHKLPRNLLTVRLMSRRYVDALLQHEEREMLLAGLFELTGFEQVPVPVEKQDKGSSSYSFSLRIAALVNAVTAFSSKPLIMVFYLGVAIMGLSSAAATYYVYRKLIHGIDVDGWASLIVSVWFLGGTAILCIGIVGIYLSKVFIEVKARPYSIVREVYESKPND